MKDVSLQAAENQVLHELENIRGVLEAIKEASDVITQVRFKLLCFHSPNSEAIGPRGSVEKGGKACAADLPPRRLRGKPRLPRRSHHSSSGQPSIYRSVDDPSCLNRLCLLNDFSETSFDMLAIGCFLHSVSH